MRTWLRQRLINLLVGEHAEIKVVSSGNKKAIGRLRAMRDFDEEDCSDTGIDLPDPINFKVQQVSGGTVIETRYYDPKKDDHRIKLHIVTPEENLAESIGKIVTMELLQK
jgi:hypothetical protein